MEIKRISLFALAIVASIATFAQEASVSPSAYYTDKEGNSIETTSIDDGEAPLTVSFMANPSDMGDWMPHFEWHFKRQSSASNWTNLLVRYEENTEYTFSESGTYNVVLKTTLINGTDTVELDSVTIVVGIAESKLEFPNGFSPNGDGINDVYQAKDGYKSIVEFHAYIFNRWGQKLFEWTDVSKGWDGTYNGKDVRDGVYFVLVKARGADGKEYDIRKDVNLLRGFSNKEGGTTTP